MFHAKQIRHLILFDCISSGIVEPSSVLRETRTGYLHHYHQENDNVRDDARLCYKNAVLLVRLTLVQRYEQGGFSMPQHLIEYLRRKGVVRD